MPVPPPAACGGASGRFRLTPASPSVPVDHNVEAATLPTGDRRRVWCSFPPPALLRPSGRPGGLLAELPGTVDANHVEVVDADRAGLLQGQAGGAEPVILDLAARLRRDR